MNVEVKDLAPGRKEINVKVPVEEVNTSYGEVLSQWNATITLPGFRKGKVPPKLLLKRFSNEINSDVKQNFISSALEILEKEHNIQVIGNPEINFPSEPEPEKECSFVLQIDIKPEVKLPDYKNIELTKEKIEVKDEEIDEYIEYLRTLGAKNIEDPKAPVDKKVILVDLEVKEKDSSEPVFKRENIFIDNNDRFEKEFEIKGWKEIFQKAQKDETYVLEGKQENKQLQIHIKVKNVYRREKAPLDKEFFEKFDVEDLEELKEEVKEQIERRKRQEQEEKLRNQLIDKLVNNTEIELSEKIVEDVTQRRFNISSLYLLRSGLQEDDKMKEERKQRTKEDVIRDLKLMFILEAIGDKERIYATEDEIQNHLEIESRRRGVSVNKLINTLEQRDMMDTFRREVREEKILKFLLENAKIVEKN